MQELDRKKTTITATTVREKVKTPSQFRVVLLNDDYTPFDFVHMILIRVFGKTDHEAQLLTMQVHVNGRATVGIYTQDIAQSLVEKTVQIARAQGHPLMATVEEV